MCNKIGKVDWGRGVKGFKCQIEEFIVDSIGNNEPLEFVEYGE